MGVVGVVKDGGAVVSGKVVKVVRDVKMGGVVGEEDVSAAGEGEVGEVGVRWDVEVLLGVASER